jgi:excisionase family DNA binding protein
VRKFSCNPPPKPEVMDATYSLKEAAELLGLTYATFYGRLDRGDYELRTVRQGNQRRIWKTTFHRIFRENVVGETIIVPEDVSRDLFP